MLQSNTNPRSSEPFQDFYLWLKDNFKSSGHSGDPPFLPSDILSDYLESNQYEVLTTLLSTIDQQLAVQISAKEVASAYLRVFCILVWIGKIEYLPAFMACDDLNDQHLPLKLQNRPRQFPFDPITDFFEEFCREQWRFCPPFIDANCNRKLEKEYVLPFTKREQIGGGASATISRIEIWPYYDRLPQLVHSADRSPAVYALKTYRGKDAEKSWRNEMRIFQKLHDTGSSPNVVGFYTAFKHGSTWHCILEYADRGSLEAYLKSHTPPEDEVDSFRLWRRILDLIRGLKDLHNGREVIFHQDIKPANVLVFSDPENSSPHASIFKICDLGTSHSKRIGATDEDDSDPDTQGTRTYGAPECYRSDSTLGQGRLRVTKAVDVFSLGCILSEVAVWMIGGYEYLSQYQQARQEAIAKIPDFHDGDCFHNGIDMLPVVGEWHKKVQSRLKYFDTFTPMLIPLIEEMLLDAQHRVDASTLCTKVHTIYAKALQDVCIQQPNRTIPDDVLPYSLRMQGQRMDLPVHPFGNDGRLETTKLTPPFMLTHSTLSNSKSSSHHLQPGPSEQVKSQLFSESDSQETLRSVHTDVASAPVETPMSIFDSSGVHMRRHSEQPPHQYRRSLNRDRPQRASMIDQAPGSAVLTRPSFRNSGPRVIINGNAFGSNVMGYSHENEPYSPLAEAETPLIRPSTSCPVKFPFETPPTRPPVKPRNQRSVPNLSRADALSWRELKKSTSRWTKDPVLRDQWVLNFIEDRDSVIIIDDSDSMRTHHWEDMTELLGIIAYMVKHFDKDGLDLYFADSNIKYNGNTSSKLVSVVERRKDEEGWGYTDMSVRLEHILGQYANKIRQQTSQNMTPRGLNVYIFTDAIWTDMCDIVPAIDKMVETLVSHKLPEKQVGLQFISFGDDDEGLKRLRLVDNYLVSLPHLPYDIVDTTPSTGSLYKMIRGAIDRNFDYASEGISSVATNSSHLPP